MLDFLWRKGIFWLGDIRRLSHWPFVTWSKDEHLVSYEEVLEALPLIRYGDVGLHRDRGYLSNLAIPGFMKHAWIHVQDQDSQIYRSSRYAGIGVGKSEVVEAISEGVLCRSPLYPMRSDYVIVLSPLARHGFDERESWTKGACLKARRMVGQPYDHRFEFNIEEELKYDQNTDPFLEAEWPQSLRFASPWPAKVDLRLAAKQFRRYDIAFTCTELVAYAWWHLREQLGIERRVRYGKQVILADDFINENWRIRWASESVTVDVARQMGLGDEGVSMIEDWRK